MANLWRKLVYYVYVSREIHGLAFSTDIGQLKKEKLRCIQKYSGSLIRYDKNMQVWKFS